MSWRQQEQERAREMGFQKIPLSLTLGDSVSVDSFCHANSSRYVNLQRTDRAAVLSQTPPGSCPRWLSDLRLKPPLGSRLRSLCLAHAAFCNMKSCVGLVTRVSYTNANWSRKNKRHSSRAERPHLPEALCRDFKTERGLIKEDLLLLLHLGSHTGIQVKSVA